MAVSRPLHLDTWANAGNVSSTGISTIETYLSTDGTAHTAQLPTLRKAWTIKPGKTLSIRVTVSRATLNDVRAGTYDLLSVFTQGSATASAVGRRR